MDDPEPAIMQSCSLTSSHAPFDLQHATTGQQLPHLHTPSGPAVVLQGVYPTPSGHIVVVVTGIVVTRFVVVVVVLRGYIVVVTGEVVS